MVTIMSENFAPMRTGTYPRKATMTRILIVEDEESYREPLVYQLTREGYDVSAAATGEEGLELFTKGGIDLVLLDLMLPGIDGYELLDYIKTTQMPVIFITAMGDLDDRVKGLRAGAEDYITKPFNILEVKARIKAILRRNSKASAKTEASNRIETGDMRMDCDSRSLFIHDKEVYLTAKEFDLLELLVLNPNKVYSRETLLNTIWGYDYPGDARTVDVHVRRLREKIEENPSEPKYVHTKWGVGYYFNV